MSYADEENKSCLIQPLNYFISDHCAAFYARLLGRPSKHLISTHAISTGGGQIVYNYEYVYDKDGYVAEMSESRKSNMFLFGSDPLALTLKYTVSYKEQEKNE